MPDLTWVFDEVPKTHAQKRNWPMAFYTGAARRHAAYVVNTLDQSFDEQAMKTGNHARLTVVILRYNDGIHEGRRKLLNNMTFATFRELTEFVVDFLEKNKSWQPLIH